MKYFITKEFSSQIELLTERKKNGYFSVTSDICNEIVRYKNTDDAWMMKANIKTLDKDVRLIKTEVKNSDQNLPKNNGYRVYLIVNKALNHICFSYVYPKRGPHGQESISDAEEVDLINCYIAQLGSETLKEVDLNNNLTVIIPDAEPGSAETSSSDESK